jgi:hypothetical protein
VVLTLLGSVLDDAVRQGTLSRNAARLVERLARQDGRCRPGRLSRQRHSSRLWRLTGGLRRGSSPCTGSAVERS